MLTPKQHELLVFIDQRLQQTGICPSFEEMKGALGLLSKAGIHRLITALEERGFLRRHYNRARALEVLRLPENVADGRRPTPAAMPRSAYPGPRGGASQFATQLADRFAGNHSDVVRVPVLGGIAGGLPVQSSCGAATYVCVPAAMLPESICDLYALEIVDDSMTDESILEGDTIIFQRDASAEDCHQTVTVTADAGVTPRPNRQRPHRGGSGPDDARYPTRLHTSNQVAAKGQLVALLRRY